jgi:hypothetical protein
MILHVHSNASYLSQPNACSRAGGLFFLSTMPSANATADPPPPINGAIHITSSIMRNVLASATEAKVGALFYNCQEACMLRTTLDEMGHPQPATPVQTDNACAEGIINDTVKQRRSKAMDMRFYWVRDRARLSHFIGIGKKGTTIVPIILPSIFLLRITARSVLRTSYQDPDLVRLNFLLITAH